MVLILNTKQIHEVNLNILKKSQKLGTNYYFTPNIGLQLYNPKVKYNDKKNIVFEFDKWKNMSLYKMLDYINSELLKKYKQSSDTIPETVYNFFNETENTFTIRAFLPYSKGKYDIQVVNKTECELFKHPRNGAVYDSVIIEIRNIWEQPTRSGFNIELKSIQHV